MKVTIPLADLHADNITILNGFNLYNVGTGQQPVFYIDDISFVGTVPSPVTVKIDASKVIRPVNAHVFGIATYGVLKPEEDRWVETSKDAGYGLHRAFYPTFNVYNGLGKGAPFAEKCGADIIGAVNYTDQDERQMTRQIPVEPLAGEIKAFGTPEEAAAMVAWANVPADAPSEILSHPLGKDVCGRDWGTVEKWVKIRASDEPVATDDGFNVMRIKHPKPFNIKMWELDNEPWMRGDATDWLGYVNFYKNADTQMKAVYPAFAIHTGVSLIRGGDKGRVAHETVNPATGNKSSGYDDAVLYYLSGQDQKTSPGRVVPDFIVDHHYYGTKAGGSADLDTLLAWQQKGYADFDTVANDYRRALKEYYGADDGAKPYYVVTEVNILSGFPLTKQFTSLTSALYTADMLGSILQSKPGDYEGLTWHDWHDGDLNKGGYYEVSSMYGWRNESGYDMYRIQDTVRTTKYPAHYAFKLFSRCVAGAGDEVVSATTDTLLVQPYAVRQKNGNLAVLLINKLKDADATVNLSIEGYKPTGFATRYSYGKVEDRNEADITTQNVKFDTAAPLTLPAYSITVLTLTGNAPAGGIVAPTLVSAKPGNGHVSLTWTAMSGADGYDVYRAAAGEEMKLLKSGIGQAEFDDRTAANGTAYHYAVGSRVKNAPSAGRSTQVTATPAAPPAAVTGFAAETSDGNVRLTWEPVAGATDYTIRRSKGSEASVMICTHPYARNPDQSLNLTTYDDRALTNGIVYTYQIAATANGVEGPVAKVVAKPIAVEGWTSVDLSPRDTGSTRYDAASGTFYLRGDGLGWYSNDEGRFVSQKLVGDGSVTAHVVSVERGGLYGKNFAGVELRDSLKTTNVASHADIKNGVNFVSIGICPIYPGNNTTYGASFNAGGLAAGGNKYEQFENQAYRPPYWVRLTRTGQTVVAELSADGKAWEKVAEHAFKNLPAELSAGIISNSETNWTTTASTLDNVTISRAAPSSVSSR